MGKVQPYLTIAGWLVDGWSPPHLTITRSSVPDVSAWEVLTGMVVVMDSPGLSVTASSPQSPEAANNVHPLSLSASTCHGQYRSYEAATAP